MTLGRFYIMVVKVTLIFGLETWVLNPRMARTLGGFHHRVVQKITGNLPKRQLYGGWQYHLISEILMEVGMEEL